LGEATTAFLIASEKSKHIQTHSKLQDTKPKNEQVTKDLWSDDFSRKSKESS